MKVKRYSPAKNIQVIAITLGLLLAVGLPVYAAFSDRSETVSFLETQGYSEVVLTGYQFFSCGRGDVYRDGFLATNSNGKTVVGVVCSGFLKGKTIRFQ